MKRIYQLMTAIAIALFIVLLPSMVKADTNTWNDEQQGIEWQYEVDSSDNIINLECKTTTVTGKVEIPATIDGKNVISLKEEIFKGYTGLTEVVFSNTLQKIGYEAFEECSGLKKISIPENVKTIGNFAFCDCTGLTEVTLNKGIIEIGTGAFMRCSGVKSIIVPEGVSKMSDRVFEGCTGLVEIELPETLTTIEESAFNGCSNLKEIKLKENVTTIGNYAFYFCKKLEKILIPDSVASIGNDNFEQSKNLTIYGNDGMKSKEFAEENDIKFDYIANWDKSNDGGDVTAPTVEAIEVSNESIANCTEDKNTKTYILPADAKIIINVKFSEVLIGNTAPTLNIKFGEGKEIELTDGNIGGSTISYTYTIKSDDVGNLVAVGLKGGDLKDAAGNEATLNCPKISVEYHSDYSVYANEKAGEIEPTVTPTPEEDGKDDSNTKKDDTTMKTDKLPQTGVGIGLTLAIILVTLFGVVMFKKVRDYKEI